MHKDLFDSGIDFALAAIEEMSKEGVPLEEIIKVLRGEIKP